MVDTRRLGTLAALVGLSYLVEAMRTAPVAPAEPVWAPGVPARFVDAGGVRLRYVSVGSGPDLVLLHTLRTQLDMFQKVVPLLARQFRVYALDLPGHGFSDIPEATYSADFFVTTVAAALDALGVRDAVVAGESIGGSIALQLAARHHPRVARVVAVNPYDYAGGTGIRRSSALANLIFGLGVPVLGETINRLRSYPVVRGVLQGGLRRPDTLPAITGPGDRTGWGIARDTAAPSARWWPTGAVGRTPGPTTGGSRCRRCWCPGPTTGRGTRSGRRTPGTYPAPSCASFPMPATSCRSTHRTRSPA